MPKATVNNQLRLAGRTAIVTGAGRGIGRAIAELYAREGARVVIASRSADGSAAAVKAIEAAGGTAIAKPMRLLGLDHIAIVVRDISETVARAGDTVDGRADGERLRGGDIDLQFLLFGETRLELIEVRAAGFGMPATRG
jgi:NAD(P)-dependent dehydrogenase (short-subunit alcohol dehydrogenase family)